MFYRRIAMVLAAFTLITPASPRALPIAHNSPRQAAQMHCRQLLHGLEGRALFSPDIFDKITGQPGYCLRLGEFRCQWLWDSTGGWPDYGFISPARWRVATREQREGFSRGFTALLNKDFGLLVARPEAYLDSCAMTHREGANEAKDEATVTTTIGEAALPLAYRLKHAKQSWLVEDVVIDGKSVVATYQPGIVSTLSQSGWDGLVKQLLPEPDVKQALPAAGVE